MGWMLHFLVLSHTGNLTSNLFQLPFQFRLRFLIVVLQRQQQLHI